MIIPGENLKARVLAAARATPSPTRRAGRRLGVLVTLAAVGISFGVFLVAGGFPDRSGRPAWLVGRTLVAWGLAATWATWGALHRKGAIAPPGSRLLAIAIGTPLMLFGFAILNRVLAPDIEPTATHGALECLRLSLLIGIWPLAALAFARRGSNPVNPGATGAALGAAAGAWAGVLAGTWCPSLDPGHVVVGHVVPIAALSLMGLFFGWQVIGVSAGHAIATGPPVMRVDKEGCER